MLALRKRERTVIAVGLVLVLAVGGYVLLRPADKLTFGEVLRLIDGPIAPLPCLSKIAYRRCADCQDEGTCEIRHVFAHVVKAQRDVLDHTTFAEAVKAGAIPEAVL